MAQTVIGSHGDFPWDFSAAGVLEFTEPDITCGGQVSHNPIYNLQGPIRCKKCDATCFNFGLGADGTTPFVYMFGMFGPPIPDNTDSGEDPNEGYDIYNPL